MTKRIPMKIALLATVTDFGGAERVVLSLIENVNSDLFDLVPIIFTVPSLAGNVFFKQLNRTGKKYYTVYVNNYKLKYLNPLVNILQAYKLLRQNKFDLIHTHGYRADVLGIFLAKLLGIPAIASCHGYISNDFQLTLYNRLDRFILRFAHRIIAVSPGIKSSLIESGIKESRITMVQNAVNGSYANASLPQNRQAKRQDCGLTEKNFVVGYVGRLSEEKGVKYLVEAVSLLNEAGTLSKLLIIGEGPQRKELALIVQKSNMAEHVIFTGFQSDIEAWLPAMDVFVLPSLTEGTPMSLLEAMAYGIPVVATAVGGVPQVIESGENGMLVSPGKPEEIRDAIYFLHKNEAARSRFSERAKTTIRLKYDVKDWINRIESEYMQILQ